MSEIEAPARGEYLIRGGTVLSMDPGIGTLERGDVHVRDGSIVAVARGGIEAPGAEVIPAEGMIVMPGLIETHFHMWSSIGRNFVVGGLRVLPSQVGDLRPLRARRLLRERAARPRGSREARASRPSTTGTTTRAPRRTPTPSSRPSRRPRARPLRVRPPRHAPGRRGPRLHRHRPRPRRVVRADVAVRRARPSRA